MLNIVLLILVFGLGIVIIGKLIELRKTYQCISPALIKDYFEGRLKKKDKEAYERVIRHLGVCEKCQNVLASLASDESDEDKIEEHLIED